MKKILLFDLDGTLFNTKPGIVKCVQYALDFYGIHEADTDDLEKFIGPPLHMSFQTFYGFDERKAAEAAAKYRGRYKDKGIFECEPYDGIADMLKMLKENGKILGVATSKPEIFAEKILEKYDMMKYFDRITGSLPDNTRSGKQEVILEELDRLKALDKRECAVMTGDREYDIIGAKAVGLTTVGVKYGFSKGDELERAGADYIADTVAETGRLLMEI